MLLLRPRGLHTSFWAYMVVQQEGRDPHNSISLSSLGLSAWARPFLISAVVKILPFKTAPKPPARRWHDPSRQDPVGSAKSHDPMGPLAATAITNVIIVLTGGVMNLRGLGVNLNWPLSCLEEGLRCCQYDVAGMNSFPRKHTAPLDSPAYVSARNASLAQAAPASCVSNFHKTIQREQEKELLQYSAYSFGYARKVGIPFRVAFDSSKLAQKFGEDSCAPNLPGSNPNAAETLDALSKRQVSGVRPSRRSWAIKSRGLKASQPEIA